MGMRALDPVAYGKLLAAALPKPIQNERELDRMVARLDPTRANIFSSTPAATY
jgi:hypothetical protein